MSRMERMHGIAAAGSVCVIGVACGLGARESGCQDGPETLHTQGLLHRSRSGGLATCWRETLHPLPALRERRSEAIAELNRRLAAAVGTTVAAGDFPVVLGGDHSCAIGTWRGVADALPGGGRLGLLWIDAHLDSHTPETSLSGAIHGMPLACLLGYGDPVLVTDGAARLAPENICVIGARSFEPQEAALLTGAGVRVFGGREIARRGLAPVFAEALELIQRGTAGFGISIDLDVLDPEEAPAVGTPVPHGLHVSELCDALRQASAYPNLMALEIAEFNPHLDPDGRTAQAVEELLQAALPRPRPALRAMELERRYGARNYEPPPVVLVKGRGAWLWDDRGRRYLDMMGGYSAVSHGHCHPRLTRALARQAQTLAVTSRAFYNDRLPLFLQRLCELTGQDQALPVNTGLEAVETALKAARKWAYRVKGVPEGRAEIIACRGNFHGRSIGIIAMSSEPQYRDGFGPFPAGFHLIPYGDAMALERAITPDTAAFLVEPVQGEGGIIVPPRGYLAACADICRRHNVLLICDEVQTGLGRTGKLLACQHEGVTPDGLVLGKALGGGLLPVSAFLARRDVMQVFTPGDHGSTFGGNPLAAAVGLEALDVLLDERLAERAAMLGPRLLRGLSAIRSPLIREARGVGLLTGIELDTRRASATALCERLMAHGILTRDTHHTVVRFSPPLVISAEQIDWALERVAGAIRELEADGNCAAPTPAEAS